MGWLPLCLQVVMAAITCLTLCLPLWNTSYDWEYIYKQPVKYRYVGSIEEPRSTRRREADVLAWSIHRSKESNSHTQFNNENKEKGRSDESS